MPPAVVRNTLINALQLNLIGPAQPDEVLDQAPSRWYFTSILASLNPGKAEPGTGSAAWETGHDLASVRWRTRPVGHPIRRIACRHPPYDCYVLPSGQAASEIGWSQYFGVRPACLQSSFAVMRSNCRWRLTGTAFWPSV